MKLLPDRGCTTRISFGSWITLPFPKRPRVQNVRHPSRHSEQRHIASAAVVLPSTAAPWLQGGSTEEKIVSPCLSRWLKPLSVCSPSTINFFPSRENFFSFFFFNKHICIFSLGCTGSLLLHRLFSSWGWQGLLLVAV